MSSLKLSLAWVARTPNVKTGNIPTAYVGTTLEECRDSCQGCALLESECYAWHGLSRVSMGRIERRYAEDAGRYSLEVALANRHPGARVARIGAMGDPANADPDQVFRADRLIRAAGLDGVMTYTHHWREPWARHLRGFALASCEFVDEAEAAIEDGWTPTVILPWDYANDGARIFPIGDNATGLVCPAQTKTNVTCNDCRMCWLGHPVWERGKIHGIGFLDHSRVANREKRRWQRGRQLPIFGKRPDVRTGSPRLPA